MTEGPTKIKPRTARSSRAMPLVEVLTGERRGESFKLREGECVLGRDPEATITLTDDGVSRSHAKLIAGEAGIVNLVDLQSTNGTFLNGARVDVAVLREGDRVELGPDVVLRFGFEAPRVEGPTEDPLEALSTREREVAALVGEGLTNAEIGKRLHISPYTVMSHLSNVYGKLEIRSRAALARIVSESLR